MAEPAKKIPPPNVQPIKSGKAGTTGKGAKLKWIVLAVAAVVLAGAGAAWWSLRPAASVAAAGSVAAAPPAAPRAAPIYYKFDPAFVVNFGGAGSARYFQVTVECMSRDQGVLDTLKNNDPAVRNDLVLLFSSQDSNALLTTDGKEKLRSQTLAAIQNVLNEEGADGKRIEQVYFTSFVIQ